MKGGPSGQTGRKEAADEKGKWDTPHPGKGLRPLHSKLGISATQLLILPTPSTAEEIEQVVGCHCV